LSSPGSWLSMSSQVRCATGRCARYIVICDVQSWQMLRKDIDFPPGPPLECTTGRCALSAVDGGSLLGLCVSDVTF
jgi:hypothetical protein